MTFLDGTNIRAHPKAAGAPRKRIRRHNATGVRRWADPGAAVVHAAGARLLLLPPYSPDFNPIEQAFAKLKALLRSAAALTVDKLHQAIRHAFSCFTPQECRNYVTAAGYEDDAAVST
jgi:transposase